MQGHWPLAVGLVGVLAMSVRTLLARPARAGLFWSGNCLFALRARRPQVVVAPAEAPAAAVALSSADSGSAVPDALARLFPLWPLPVCLVPALADLRSRRMRGSADGRASPAGRATFAFALRACRVDLALRLGVRPFGMALTRSSRPWSGASGACLVFWVLSAATRPNSSCSCSFA